MFAAKTQAQLMHPLIYYEDAGTHLQTNLHTLLDFSRSNHLFHRNKCIRINLTNHIIKGLKLYSICYYMYKKNDTR